MKKTALYKIALYRILAWSLAHCALVKRGTRVAFSRRSSVIPLRFHQCTSYRPLPSPDLARRTLDSSLKTRRASSAASCTWIGRPQVSRGA